MSELIPFLRLEPWQMPFTLGLALVPVFLWLVALRRPAFHLGLPAFAVFFFAAVYSIVFDILPLDWLDSGIAQTLLKFFILGLLIEYGKNFIVRIAGRISAKNFDDILDLSFLSGLGFFFGESVYLISKAFLPGGSFAEASITSISFYFEQLFYLAPIHLFASGLFGFYYGLGLYASDTLQRPPYLSEYGNKFVTFVERFVSRRTAYSMYQTLIGTWLSVGLFSLFYLVYSSRPTVQDVVDIFGVEIKSVFFEMSLIPPFALVFFYLGTVLLFSQLDRIRNYRHDDLLLGEELQNHRHTI